MGTAAIVLTGRQPLFSSLVVPASALAAPVILALSWFFLRPLPVRLRRTAGLELGVLVTAVQFPLDGIGWFALARLSYLPTNRDALVVALEVGYFCLLVIPIAVGWYAGACRDAEFDNGMSERTPEVGEDRSFPRAHRD